MGDGDSPAYVDCYSILGVDPDATRQEIETGYIVAMNSLQDGRALARFKAFWFNRSATTISIAHQTLMDPVSRALYDEKYRQQNAIAVAPPY